MRTVHIPEFGNGGGAARCAYPRRFDVNGPCRNGDMAAAVAGLCCRISAEEHQGRVVGSAALDPLHSHLHAGRQLVVAGGRWVGLYLADPLGYFCGSVTGMEETACGSASVALSGFAKGGEYLVQRSISSSVCKCLNELQWASLSIPGIWPHQITDNIVMYMACA